MSAETLHHDILKKYPEISRITQSRDVIRDYITGKLEAGPIGPFVIYIDPATDKERAIEIQAAFAKDRPDQHVVVASMEAYRDR